MLLFTFYSRSTNHVKILTYISDVCTAELNEKGGKIKFRLLSYRWETR